MSWSISIPASPDGQAVRDAIVSGRPAALAQNPGAEAQIDLMTEIVETILDTDALGEAPWRGYISGHVQAGEGSAKPSLSLSLSGTTA